MALGKGTSEPPTSCEQTETTFNCFWETSQSGLSGTLRVGLSKFQDKVGNLGTTPEIELIADNAGPKVEKLEVLGLSDVGDKTYFQSNDRLKVKLTAVESHGLIILVNLNNVVMDAESKFPAGSVGNNLPEEAGWQVFTNEDCEFSEGSWECELLTAEMKSGPDKVAVELRVQDTAGNDAQAWPEQVKNGALRRTAEGLVLEFELLGLSEENNPDFWETSKVTPLVNFIDLDTTELINTRAPFSVRLNTKSKAKLIGADLLGCETNVSISAGRQWLLNTHFADGQASPVTFTLLLEFPPFNGKDVFTAQIQESEKFRTAVAPFTCQLRLFSQLSKQAIRLPEIQEVQVNVPFGFTELGKVDENLDEKIRNEIEAVQTGLWGTIEKLNKFLKIVNYGVQVAQVIMDINIALQLAKKGMEDATLALEASQVPGVSDAAFSARFSFCLGADLTAAGVSAGLDWLQKPLAVLTCKKIIYKPGENPGTFGNFYNKWVFILVNTYNDHVDKYLQKQVSQRLSKSIDKKGKVLSREDLIPSAVNTYDNLYLSVASLCLPGIIHNLEKLRQIKCKHITCLQNEVAQGLATVEACDQLQDVLTCKYFWGPAFQLIPLVNFWDTVVRAVQSMFTDPLNLVSSAIILGCSTKCLFPVKGTPRLTLSAGCVKAHFVIKMVKVVEEIWSAVQDIKAGLAAGQANYCDQVQEITG